MSSWLPDFFILVPASPFDYFNNHVYCTLGCSEGTPSVSTPLPPPFPQRSLEAWGAKCSQALPAPRCSSVTVGSRREGERGRQVSLTTLPPSSLGRCWPGLRYHITDGEEPSGLFRVSRPSQGEEGGRLSPPSACRQPPPSPTARLGHLALLQLPFQGPTPSSPAPGLPGRFLCPLSHGSFLPGAPRISL